MTKREAIRLVRDTAVKTLRHDVTNGSGWVFDGDDGEPRPERDVERIKAAIEDVCRDLTRGREVS